MPTSYPPVIILCEGKFHMEKNMEIKKIEIFLWNITPMHTLSAFPWLFNGIGGQFGQRQETALWIDVIVSNQ